jgi:hypothetical protein
MQWRVNTFEGDLQAAIYMSHVTSDGHKIIPPTYQHSPRVMIQ